MEDETKTLNFQLITFIKQNILDYFYTGDKLRILLVRLDNPSYKAKEAKVGFFNKALSNEIDNGRSEIKRKKPKPKIEVEEKPVEKEVPVHSY